MRRQRKMPKKKKEHIISESQSLQKKTNGTYEIGYY